MKDFRDFYILGNTNNNYDSTKIIIDDELSVIIQKIEMCLMTNKGDFVGDLNFGCDLDYYVFSTNVSADFIKSNIQNQFNTYIPELNNFDYYISTSFLEGTIQDILVVDIQINNYSFRAIVR